MSNYAAYIKEREGKEIVEDSFGFATYCYPSPDVCYIVDIYVRPENRKQGLAASYADQISKLAKEKGARMLLGSAQPGLPGSSDSFKTLLAYGMAPTHIAGNLVYFTKELN